MKPNVNLRLYQHNNFHLVLPYGSLQLANQKPYLLSLFSLEYF